MTYLLIASNGMSALWAQGLICFLHHCGPNAWLVASAHHSLTEWMDVNRLPSAHPNYLLLGTQDYYCFPNFLCSEVWSRMKPWPRQHKWQWFLLLSRLNYKNFPHESLPPLPIVGKRQEPSRGLQGPEGQWGPKMMLETRTWVPESPCGELLSEYLHCTVIWEGNKLFCVKSLRFGNFLS